MALVYHGAPPATAKPFAWSYSRLKNFEACPRKHYEVDVLKRHKEDSEALTYGNALHKAAAQRISKGTPLPAGYDDLEAWCVRVIGDGGGDIHVELQLAINKDFGPCDWFGKDAWFRSVADVLKIVGDVGLALDWKTGKIVEDSVQLALMGACIFAHFPQLMRIRTEFAWLAHNASSREDFSRADMPALWKSLWPRIEQLRQAHETQTYPAKPGGLCRRWCPVSECPHHGN